MERGNASPDGRRAGTTYVYATRLLGGRSRFTFGLSRLRPPGQGRGWDNCAISYVDAGLLVSWRCISRIEARRRD